MTTYQSMGVFLFTMCFALLVPFSFADTEPQRETWVNLRGQEVSVFNTSVELLLVRDYFEQKSMDGVVYSSQIDIEKITFDVMLIR